MIRIFFAALVLILIQESQSECVESFRTICDNMEDIYKSRIDVTFKDVVVQSNTSTHRSNFSCLHLDLLYNELKYVHSVTFVQQLSGFCGKPKCFKNTKIKYMTFYKNYLPHLNYWFLQCQSLKKLSLISNRMKTIGNLAFRYAKIEEIDLTDNRIKIIRRDYGLNNSTQVLIFRKNKLTFIQPRSLPSTLEHLDLSYNELTGVLEAEVIDQLYNLEYLYLSHNKIKVFPDVSKLIVLKIVDISYNNIFTVDVTETTKPARTLELLNLSHNEITSFDFVLAFACEVFNENRTLEVALHFNLVKETKIEDFNICVSSNRTVYLSVFGNPWSCREFDDFERMMAKNKMRHSCCDELHLRSGVIPYCIAESPYDITNDDISNFIDVLKNRSHLVECNLSTTGNCNLLSL